MKACICLMYACKAPGGKWWAWLTCLIRKGQAVWVCFATVFGMTQTHGGRHTAEFVWPASVSVLVCFRFVLNLRSCSDVWFSSVCGVRVCMCVVCICVWFVAVYFLHLSMQPTRPTQYAMRDFYRPFQGLQDRPREGRHTVEFVRLASVSVLVCFLSVLKG